ncbi:MAG: ABC transporter substrate-binding protein [Formivibrio sp.]|nr:ABC transporter substrate-binding protein [Formivibrio sp.]
MFRILLAFTSLLFLIELAHADPSRLARVQSSKILRVCIWPDYYGITYRNPRTQQLSGIDIDLAQALASDLGVSPVFVDSNFARLIDDIEQDRCDIAMFAVGVLPQRAEKLSFSHPYLQSDIYAITTQTNRRIKNWDDIDKPGVAVAVAKGTLHETVMREKLKHASLEILDSPHAREQEVESGRADVFMTDYPYSRRMLETTDWARLVAPSGVYQLTSYAYAMQKGDLVWLARIEQFVSDIKRDGRLLAAAKRQKLDAIVVNH